MTYAVAETAITRIHNTVTPSLSTEYDYTIDAMPVFDALLMFCQQSNLTFLAPRRAFSGLISHPLQGVFTVNEGLKTLLIESPLQVSISDVGQLVFHNLPRINIPAKKTIEARSRLEEITVRGIRYALHNSVTVKRQSSVIEDVISEYDIGKMPDSNVPSLLSRLSGINMERRSGEGTKVRVRGFDNNLVLYNGEVFFTGMEYFQMGFEVEAFENSLETIPVELLQSVEVQKSTRASDIEGSIGGTINLLSRSAFDVDSGWNFVELGGNYGRYSQQAKPHMRVSMGHVWDERLAIASNIFYGEKVLQSDEAHNYFYGGLLYQEPVFDGVSEMPPHLVPQLARTSDVERFRAQGGASINIGFKPSNETLLEFEWLGIANNTQERSFELAQELRYTRGSEPHVINQDQDLYFLESGRFTQMPQFTSTMGEHSQVRTNNLSLLFKAQSAGNFAWDAKLNYSRSKYFSQLGYARADLIVPTHPDGKSFMTTWLPETEVESRGGLLNQGGWTLYEWAAGDELGPIVLGYLYDVSSPLIAQYENTDIFADKNNYINNYAQAKGGSTLQSGWSLQSNIKYFFDDLDNSERYFALGWRLSARDVNASRYKFLTNFAETQGVLQPTLFRQDGSVKVPSTYDRSIAPNAQNIGVNDVYYADLCGNGGIALDQACDIDGDGISDNTPYGPWRAEMDPFNPILSSYSPELLYQLYGEDFNPDTAVLTFAPNHIPWQRYSESPSEFLTVNNFYPSYGEFPSLTFINPKPILGDVEKWISDYAPNSPMQRFTYLPQTWRVNEKTLAIYGEYNQSFTEAKLDFNAGLRAVYTQMQVFKHVLTDDPDQVSLTEKSWYVEGLSGWNNKRYVNDYWNLLPSLNINWEFADAAILRVGMGKTIARPNFRSVGVGLVPQYTQVSDNGQSYNQASGGVSGNEKLQTTETVYFDVSQEFYYGNTNYLQLGYFYKHIDNAVQQTFESMSIIDESFSGETSVDVLTYSNSRSSYAKGWEFAWQHVLDSGWGVHLNFTNIKSHSPIRSYSRDTYGIPGVPNNTANMMLFFENQWLSVKLAYNWMDEYVSPYRTFVDIQDLSSAEPENLSVVQIFDRQKQWDARFLWYVTRRCTLLLDWLNLTREQRTSYLEFSKNKMTYRNWEPRFNLSLKLDF